MTSQTARIKMEKKTYEKIKNERIKKTATNKRNKIK
jgi:hypothetical protein